ncbi:MAG: CaiB/BaiF CoA transferase family protein [Candidatus Helarchaeota archaeon]
MDRILEGLIVLDLSQFFSGPWGSTQLSDQGAEVIKIEPPGVGEPLRLFVLFNKQISPLFSIINRNKKSITLNLRYKEGQEIFKELVKHVDIVLENFTPGVMKKWGLDYETVLKPLNPQLIYGAISGFGQTGLEEYCSQPAFDVIAQASSGMLDANEIKGAPHIPYADLTAGHFIALGVSQALYYREKTGKGVFIDLSMQDMMYNLNIRAHAREFMDFAKNRKKGGLTWLPTYNQYPTKDGKRVAIVCVTEKQFKKMMVIIRRQELVRDRRFKNAHKRMNHIEELDEILTEWTSSLTRDEIIGILTGERIPCSPVLSVDEVRDHPQLSARGTLLTHFDFSDDGVEKATIPNVILRFSEAGGKVERKAPKLGEHNIEIYGRFLDYSDEKIKELTRKGII